MLEGEREIAKIDRQERKLKGQNNYADQGTNEKDIKKI